MTWKAGFDLKCLGWIGGMKTLFVEGCGKKFAKHKLVTAISPR